MNAYPLPWADPLAVARGREDAWMALLHSTVQAPHSGQFSILACDLRERIEGDDFTKLEQRLTADREPFANAWFGLLGYPLRHCLEQVPADAPPTIALPPLLMMRFGTVFVFDHAARALTCHADAPTAPLKTPPAHPAKPRVTQLQSNMTKMEFMQRVEHIIAAIHAGELYQANLTRKFFGTLDAPPDSLALFEALCASSPSPYSAYLRCGGVTVLSSSPEQFLHLQADGRASTRPIKGSAPRHADAGEDARARARLAASEKERAENLMIVDLMRNDLSRAAAPGSVQVESLFDITSHATVHHMSSTVTARRAEGIGALEMVKRCFPPGSMTGAPKIRAMQMCSALEGMERGIYSGALGWFGGDGSADLSVVIRTLLLHENRFEFQAGSGIVADSDPEMEWREALVKARAIAHTLGLEEAMLAAL